MSEEFVNGAIDGEVEEDFGSLEPKKGRWKIFNDIIYNQNEVDPYSCTVVATYSALSNLTGKKVGYGMMKRTLDRMRKDGKFRPGFGASLKDGVAYSVEDWNKEFKTTYKANLIYLSPSSLVEGLSHSPVVTGIKYGKGFVNDTQDDAWINSPKENVKGSQGHAITVVVVNTMEDTLLKLLNTYEGRLEKNVFGVDFNKYRDLFFNSGYYFTKK